MYKKTITYTDYFGVERTEDFYFNLTISELMQLQLSTQQGFYNEMQTLIDSHDGPKIMDAFNKIIMQAYGEKSEDGRRFIKSPEISKAFTETPAYDKFFMELIEDSKAAAEFINGIVPKDKKLSSDETAKIIAMAEAKN